MTVGGELGVSLFIGRDHPRDYRRAFELMLHAADAGDENVVPWLEMYRPLPPPVKGVATEPEPVLRMDHGPRMLYPFPREFDLVPEKKVLDALCGLDGEGRCEYEEDSSNGYGGFENGTFCTIPYLWLYESDPDYAQQSELPNFRFKPTGFEVEWYKHPRRDSHMNRDIDINGFRGILRCCIRSVLEQIDRGELRCPASRAKRRRP